jgi:YkoY family integral membrane protein
MIEAIVSLFAIIVLEALLSVDNSIVIATVAQGLPKHLRRRALTYGLGGAICFRIIAIWFIQVLINWQWLRLVGGAYLVIVCLRHFLKGSKGPAVKMPTSLSFWKVILKVELLDIIFSIDSILASVGMSKNYWLVVTGGVAGVVMMRFTSSLFIRLLDSLPALHISAYLIVGLVGGKLILEYFQLEHVDLESHTSFAFWIFWTLFFLSIVFGLISKRTPKISRQTTDQIPQ